MSRFTTRQGLKPLTRTPLFSAAAAAELTAAALRGRRRVAVRGGRGKSNEAARRDETNELSQQKSKRQELPGVT